MEITALEELGVTIFTLKGRIDSDGADVLKNRLMEAVSDGKHNMILEMSKLTYINSAGLRVLAEVLTENKTHGGDLRLVGLDAKVRRVFEIIGFSNFFRIYNSVLEAMEGY